MLAMYGKTEGKTCRRCVHLLRHRHSKKVFRKCEFSRKSCGSATDWKAGWPACGKYEEGEK